MATNEVIESLAFLEKYNKKKIPQRKGESILDAVKRVTHLYLNDRSIKEIVKLSVNLFNPESIIGIKFPFRGAYVPHKMPKQFIFIRTKLFRYTRCIV